MKAIVLHEYGPASKLKYEDFPDPKPGPGEVLVRVQAASINPIDWKMRSGAAKEHFPVTFPAVLGRDVAGTVRELGDGVENFMIGDRVFALAWGTYAEFCVVKASQLAVIPEGLEMTTAAAVPLVSLTGDQLIHNATEVQAGQTIVLTGAVGSVGRCAMFAARELGAKVIAGVRKSQIEEAKKLGALDAIDVDDPDAVAKLGMVDGVADAVGGEVGSRLLGKVKPGGHFGSLLGPPKDAALHPTVIVKPMTAQPDSKRVIHFGEAVRDGKLKLPIERIMPLKDAAEAQSQAEKGGAGKFILVP